VLKVKGLCYPRHCHPSPHCLRRLHSAHLLHPPPHRPRLPYPRLFLLLLLLPHDQIRFDRRLLVCILRRRRGRQVEGERHVESEEHVDCSQRVEPILLSWSRCPSQNRRLASQCHLDRLRHWRPRRAAFLLSREYGGAR
jgi:hypothetical protein